MEDFAKLVQTIETAIQKPFHGNEHLVEALTHRSYVNESLDKDLKDNERYEFLGDAVLQLIVSDFLMNLHPDKQEGTLSKYRSMIVNEKSLAEVARSLDLGTYIRLGRGEEITQGRKKDSILANSFEALLAAIYLSHGVEDARKFVLEFVGEALRNVGIQGSRTDFKTALQEMTQRTLKKIPIYHLLQETGPDHDKMFETEVLIDDRVYGRGKAKSKKDSEQICAEKAIEILKSELENQKESKA